jgi:hypothetical protein
VKVILSHSRSLAAEKHEELLKNLGQVLGLERDAFFVLPDGCRLHVLGGAAAPPAEAVPVPPSTSTTTHEKPQRGHK